MLAKGLGGECLKLYKTISVMLAVLFLPNTDIHKAECMISFLCFLLCFVLLFRLVAIAIVRMR